MSSLFKCGSGVFSFRKRWQPRYMDYIDKSHCNLTMVPDDVLRHERHLEELLLDANQIQELPKAIFRMYKLRKLILSDNEILDLTSELGNLVALEEFDISKNDIRGVPDTIDKLKKLTCLDVSNNTLGELPDSITRLSDLRNLVVNDVALGEIPPEIGSLNCLVILELRDNCIRFLPMSFSFLGNLQKLDLGGNELEELPDTIGQLTNLQELWLDNNYLTSLPLEIGELSNLQCLDISENRIEELPEEMGGLISLTLLIVSSNLLHDLPDGIGLLTRLQILKAEQNELDDLVESIGGCIALEELMLTDNSIEFLPAAIGYLTRLTNLNIDRNRLFTLPPEIGECHSLTLLCARDNQIDKVPKEIGNCRNLAVLDLSGNKLVNLPLSVSTLPLKALWLSQNQSQSVLKLQVDDDDAEEKVLTCFLFPQEKLKPSCSIENLMNEVYDDAAQDGKTWQSVVPKSTAVQFESCDMPKESNLTRKGTPYPKDMRDRHPNLVKKRSDSVEGEKVISRGNSLRDSYQSDTSETGEKSLEKKAGVTIATKEVIIGDDGGIDNPYLLDEVGQSEDDEEIREKPEEFNDERTVDDDAGDDNNDDYDDDDDDEKHVNFIVNEDGDERKEDDVCRLQRRDTPHHFKGKRIVDSEEGEARVLEILSSIEKHNSTEVVDDDNICSADMEMDQVNGIDVQCSSHDDVKIIKESTDEVDYHEHGLNNENQPISGIDVIKTVGESTMAGRIPVGARDDEPKVEVIILKKSEGPLGISIVGGCDHSSHPFGVEDPGVFVSKVNADGEAAKSNLRVGDRILAVDDQDMTNAMHHDAVAALVSNGEELKLLVRHEPSPPGLQEIIINKQLGEKLGISIRGGAKGHPGNPFDKDDEGIFVSKVNASGAASRSGQLTVGMRILEVNGASLLGATHVDAVRALRTAGDNLDMVVAYGYDPSLVENTNREDVLYNVGEGGRFSPDSFSEETTNNPTPTTPTTPTTPNDVNSVERKSGNQIKRTPSEQRAIEADKRAKWRQERMAALENDAKKAQVVIAQSKQYSSNSLDEGPVVSDADERTST